MPPSPATRSAADARPESAAGPPGPAPRGRALIAAKEFALGLARLAVWPCVLAFRVEARLLGEDRAFPGWSQGFSLLPGVLGGLLRAAFYRAVLSACGDDACLGFGAVFSDSGAEVGHRVYVGPYSCLGRVTLEDDVLVASHVSVMNGAAQHGIERLDVPIREQPGLRPRVTIGRGSWIGERAVVMADVGDHCVVGAGAVVVKPIPDYAIAVGIPARVVRYRGAADATATVPAPAPEHP